MVFTLYLKYTTRLIVHLLLVIVIWELVAREKFLKLSKVLNSRQTDGASNIVFNQLDVDSSGFLSFTEWFAYFSQVSGENPGYIPAIDSPLHVSNEINDWFQYKFNFEKDDSILSIKASFEPLDLNSTMKQFKEENNIHPGSMQGLLNWQVPSKPWQNVAAKQFALFLPPKGVTLSPGTIWWVVAPQQTRQMPSNHYEPPPVSSSLIFLQDLLKMFHLGASILTRFPPQGTAALIRAFNQNNLDIFFRSHAEFQLNEKPALPFWFTPAQFQGRLIIDKNASGVVYFSMSVPNSRPLNVDMEWICGTEPGQMEVDLGFVPEMKLESSSPSVPISQLGDMASSFIHCTQTLHSLKLKWDEEISEDKAWSLLENQFFTFKKVPYYNISEAFERAIEEDKLVHTLVLFGSLDDQSC